MRKIDKKIEAIKEELKKPLPPHNPEKEKTVMATKKKASKKKVSKKASKKVSKKATKRVAKKAAAKKEKVEGVTLKDLAAEAGLSGQKARVKLRAAGITREKGSRWIFANKKDEAAARKALGL